jgi:hypothetical protein
MPNLGEELNMAKRKPDPALVGQMDMFGDIVTGVENSVVPGLLSEGLQDT